ncbi:MAG: amidohydrolase [Oceanospirillaceae bacterium]|nr:amidohydrolase [Oceanospirillaceae bacterium]
MKLHTCGAGCAPSCSSDAKADAAGKVRSARAVDFHCHVFVPQIEQLIADQPGRIAEKDQALNSQGPRAAEHNARVMVPTAMPKLIDPEVRLRDMDAMGVALQVLSPSPSQYYYWADPGLSQQLVEIQNAAISKLVNRYPERMVGLGTVSLQHPELAVAQLESAVAVGLKGVEISTNVNGRNLSDPALEPFWRKAESLGCVIFIHPFGADFGPRLVDHYLSNVIGQPLETAIALSHLIFDCVLDRYPRLKLLAAHGGGYLPFYAGRSDHAWAVRPDVGRCAGTPSDYLRRIWFDTLVFDPAAVRFLIERVGIDRVVIGTDYPFDMGDCEIHPLLQAIPELTEEERRQVMYLNALQLLGLPEALLSEGEGAANPEYPMEK